MRWDAGRKATSSSKYLQVYFPAGFFLGGHLDIFFFYFGVVFMLVCFYT